MRGKCTFVVLVDVLDDDWFLLLLFDGVGGVGDGIGLVKFVLFLLVCVSSDSAGGKFLELVPVIDYLVTARPPFLGVMENRLSAMVVASRVSVLLFFVVLKAAGVLASELTFGCRHF